MRRRAPGATVLTVLALACTGAHGDPAAKPPRAPDPGFLEFLGGVDGLSDVNPDYLSQPDGARAPQGAPGSPPAAFPQPAPAPAGPASPPRPDTRPPGSGT